MIKLKGHRSQIGDLSLSPTDALLVSIAGEGQRVTLWDLNTGKRSYLAGSDRAMRQCCFSPDGNAIAGVNELGRLLLWNPEQKVAIAEYRGDGGYSFTLGHPEIQFSPKGDWIYVANRTDDLLSLSWLVSMFGDEADPALRRYTIDGLNEQPIFSNPGLPIDTFAFAPDGLIYLTYPEMEPPISGEQMALDVITSEGDVISEDLLPLASVDQMMISSNNRFLAIRSTGFVLCFDIESKESINIPIPDENVWSMTFTADGDGILMGDEAGAVWFVEIASQSVVENWKWDIGVITALDASANGELFVAGGEGPIMVWDAVG